MAKAPIDDKKPWIAFAQELLSGKRKMPKEGSERDSVLIGMRSVNHKDCKQVVQLLEKKK